MSHSKESALPVTHQLKAPFPYFGGKLAIADVIWSRFGSVSNYIDPFFGSGAVLFARPNWEGTTETINDADAWLVNVWRAMKADPEQVAGYCDWPVTELDLIARNRWFLRQKELYQQLKDDPEFYDCRAAGWWVWGKCAWIGSGWATVDSSQLPHLGDAGRGERLIWLTEWFSELSHRLRDVRIANGDWTRVLGDSATYRHGMTGVFLDPPYTNKATRTSDIYAVDCEQVGHEVAKWAIENGNNRLMRIAVCGYEGEYDFPADWECFQWSTAGGYGSQGDKQGRANKKRERIWFSPYCLSSKQAALF
jgi:site-specific DNA-adenine methylase